MTPVIDNGGGLASSRKTKNSREDLLVELVQEYQRTEEAIVALWESGERDPIKSASLHEHLESTHRAILHLDPTWKRPAPTRSYLGGAS